MRSAFVAALAITLIVLQPVMSTEVCAAGSPQSSPISATPTYAVRTSFNAGSIMFSETDVLADDARPTAVTKYKLAATAKIKPGQKADQTNRSRKQSVAKVTRPMRTALAELGHPFDILKSIQRRLWSNWSSADVEDYLSGRTLGPRAFDVRLVRAPVYSLSKKSSVIASGHIPLYAYMLPTSSEALEAKEARDTATQLQVRMRGDWSVLYEVNRATSVIDHDDIGVGLGVRYAF